MDIGATNTRLAVASEDGCIVASAQAATAELGDAGRLVEWVAARLRELAPGPAPSCIGVAAPGPLDPRRGVVTNPPNLPGWRDVPLADLLGAAVGCPAHLENDANVAALGEFRAGAGRGTTNMVYVTWSSGVGAGLILDGRLFSGSHGAAGEIGHTVLDPNGPLDRCGQPGCVEAFCGGHALADQTGLPADALFAAAAAGDAGAVPVVRRAATYMGWALVNLTNIFDPDMIVMGGGVTRSWEHVEPMLLAALHGSPYIVPSRRPALRLAELGDRAGLIGAVEWARTHLP
jgi:glucokinase